MNTPAHEQTTTPARDPDVLIMGGGLAGLTLALQLKQRRPELNVLVLERRAHPVPEACHKVGESSVEIGAHCFQKVLGLKQRLMDRQLKKLGFRFFFSEDATDIASVSPLGASGPLAVPGWQIDRGIFENFLGQAVQRRGIRFVDQSLIRSVQLAAAPGQGNKGALHQVSWQRPGEAAQNTRALAVDQPPGGHRLPVVVDPADSGLHTVGIVADPRHHRMAGMNTFEGAMQWLRQHQPLLHADLQAKLAAKPDVVQDSLRAWCGLSGQRNPALMLDQASVPWFAELNRSLQDPLDDAGFRQKLRDSALRLRAPAGEVLARGCEDYPGLAVTGLGAAVAAAGGAHLSAERLLFPSCADATA